MQKFYYFFSLIFKLNVQFKQMKYKLLNTIIYFILNKDTVKDSR